MTAIELDLARRYVELGLRLGRHNPDFVDSYHGPLAWRLGVDAEPVRPPAALVAEAAGLIADLDADDTLDGQRRAWLRNQTVGLHTVGRVLGEEPIDYLDEVELCYGVRPEPITDDEVREAHRQLDAALSGGGSLVDRMAALRASHVVPSDSLREVIDNLAEAFRERTRQMFGLPDGERVTFDLVTDKPYSGFNFYQGDLESLVTINTDLPVLATTLAHLVSHEAYPGHHTEHCHKEVGLVDELGRIEQTISMIGTGACLLAEGLADLGLEVLMGADSRLAVAPMFADAGVHYDAEAVAATAAFGTSTERARGTLAMMLHHEGRSHDEVVDTAKRWLLYDDARARQSIRFLDDRTWRAYIFNYAEGYRLCRAFVGGDPLRFARLLDEPLTPADLADGAVAA